MARRTYRLVLAVLLGGCAATPPLATPTSALPPREASAAPPIRQLLRTSRDPNGLDVPPATRQIDEGYWLGAMLDKEHVRGLGALGVRVVVSAVRPSEPARLALAEAGVAWVSVAMGSTFDHAAELLEVLDHYAPEEVYIHCRHGADRTGAIAAFILVVRHGWTVADALYSVVYPSDSDVAGLGRILDDFGIIDARAPDDPSVGFYSLRAAGAIGGLKARNARYARLVATTIEAIRARTP